MLQALSDRHPYVRRTAVMGVLKIWHVDKSVVESTGARRGARSSAFLFARLAARR